ncbi:hypothetical protein [Chitinophaga pinensis]|uniref:SGNH/GDSL hydrolase family protein n=1 Tax=Chitinophaga pinensis (strain ATCC 43595 / DSM 2588 / LMG 13176 / NBRC 15968 / NCIMB 11800 / UQM 2034) TaxID=485918 RepID=A0A979G4V3_CHIPD|nr:hypothetical protein [Chitinophaga pinensis]ACU60894.1 hypothetical protein Cpin_3427 [Chitinophaga pinensis DSM 2588]
MSNIIASQQEQANQLASLLYKNAGPAFSGEINSLATSLGIEQLPGTEDLTALPTVAAQTDDLISNTLPERVGIWTLGKEDGVELYTRDVNARMDWWLWAKNHQFSPQPSAGKKRVILLGESVARGYLYDPFYTVAHELEALLNLAAPGTLDTEVLDLARTDLSLPILRGLLPEALALKPAAVVIFAGNNWLHTMKDTVSPADYQELCRLQDKGLLSDVRALLETRFRDMVKGFLTYAHTLSAQTGIPITFVIPEFNLGDWNSNPQEKNATRLTGSGAAKWAALVENGEEALLANNYELLENVSSRMTALDMTHPLGYEWKAICRKAAGDWQAARSLMESARDTAIYGRAESKPRCFRIIRDTILKEAPALGITVVDLPAVFTKLIPDALPGLEVFLDYCHLTVEGIKLSMKPTAETVAGILLGTPVKVNNDSGLYPDDEVRAVAHIAAAVHNAHYGQAAPVLQYHCQEAAAATDQAKDVMRNFIDFSSRRLQNALCKTHEELVESGIFTQYEGGLGFIHERRRKLLDIALVDAMTPLASTAGESLADDILALRIAQHTPAPGKTIDLLEKCYSTTSYDVFNVELPEVNYYQARHHRSDFTFIADGSIGFTASLIARAPGTNQEIRVLLNGAPLSTLQLEDKWTTFNLDITDAALLRKGVNTLSVRWPAPEWYRKTDPATVQTPAEFLDFMYPVWGEIYVFELLSNKEKGQLSDHSVPGRVEASLLSV